MCCLGPQDMNCACFITQTEREGRLISRDFDIGDCLENCIKVHQARRNLHLAAATARKEGKRREGERESEREREREIGERGGEEERGRARSPCRCSFALSRQS